MRSLWLMLALLVLIVPAAHGQVPPEKAEATFTVADGMEFKLWASEPLFVNPTCIDIDHKGRVWVCESVNYRCHLHKKPLNRKEGDRIVVLEDTKGTGKADKATTFYQAPDFIAPLGIAVAPYPDGKGVRVYVCHSPDILVFEDKDGDGKADGPPKKLLSGFGGYDHDHGVHGIMIGPDGKLYFSVGDTGVHGLQSSDGKGRKWESNETDCRAGTIWRCDLDGKNLELIAHNFRNEYEPCVDSFGTIFTSDNDDDGNEQTRICYVMPGGDYGYHPRGPGQTHWHEEQPGVVPKILRTGFGSPTGMCVHEGSLLPLANAKRKRDGFTTQLLHCDAGPREVRCYHLKPDGAGYQIEKQVLVSSTDTWFRPSDICVAPDGSAFVADWYDPGVGGHGMGDTTRGRIYRLAPKGNKPSVPGLNVDSKEGIKLSLASPNIATRARALMLLKSLNDDNFFELARHSQNERENPYTWARVTWLVNSRLDANRKGGPLTSWGYDDPPAFLSDQRLMTMGARILAPTWFKALGMGFVKGKGLAKASCAEKREVALSFRDEDPNQVNDAILELAKFYDGKDRFYLEAIGIAVGHHAQKRREIILADFEMHFPQWNDKVADLVWELQPPSVMAKLPAKLSDKSLTPAQRARIVDILAVSQDKDAGKSLLKVLESDVPDEVRQRIFANLRLFLPNKWRALRSSDELKQSIDRLVGKPATQRIGLSLIAAAERKDYLPYLKQLTQADDPQTRLAAVQTLGELPASESVSALEGLLKIRRGPVALAAVQALGKQVPLYGDAPGAQKALALLKNVVQDGNADAELRSAAVGILAESHGGAHWLLQLNAEKRLPDALKPEAARVLRNSAFQDVRNRAVIAFPPAKLDPKKLPDIARLAKLRGNAEHGKQILAASVKTDLQCLKCHTIHGQGGQIGPDLSQIGQKASRENLLESILYPSKAIADQFVTWNIVTRDGKALSGLVIEDTADHVLLRDANGKDTKIDKKDIEAREKDPKSIMPDNLLAYMTEDDLLDLVEYLLTLKGQN